MASLFETKAVRPLLKPSLQCLDEFEGDISEGNIQISIALQQALLITWQLGGIDVQAVHQILCRRVQRKSQAAQCVVLESAYGTRFNLRDSRCGQFRRLCQLALAKPQLFPPCAYALTQICHLTTDQTITAQKSGLAAATEPSQRKKPPSTEQTSLIAQKQEAASKGRPAAMLPSPSGGSGKAAQGEVITLRGTS